MAVCDSHGSRFCAPTAAAIGVSQSVVPYCNFGQVGRIYTAVTYVLGLPGGACKHATTLANLRGSLYHIGLATDQGFVHMTAAQMRGRHGEFETER